MPWMEGGAPVTMETLFGFVNVGTTASTIRDVQPGSVDASQGIAPASTARVT
jgi:hypothetical protein